jgi:hypothetical protein
MFKGEAENFKRVAAFGLKSKHSKLKLKTSRESPHFD